MDQHPKPWHSNLVVVSDGTCEVYDIDDANGTRVCLALSQEAADEIVARANAGDSE